MIMAKDLKVGDKITCIDGKEYIVVYNRCDASVKRLTLRYNMCVMETVLFYDVTLFYDEDVECAKNTFGIDLLGWYIMIKASDLKVGDMVISTTGIEYEVIGNHVGGVLTILANNGTGDHLYDRLHLFYDDIDYLEYAKDILNINLTTK